MIAFISVLMWAAFSYMQLLFMSTEHVVGCSCNVTEWFRVESICRTIVMTKTQVYRVVVG